MLISSSIDNELLKFIQSKKMKSTEINAKEIYQLYTKMLSDILYNVHKSFSNTEYSIICCELAHSIFMIILHQTNNTKLAMFLCDRAKILFIEYINICNEMVYDSGRGGASRRTKENINILDVKLYIYSKTIGPLSLSSNKNIKISKLKNLFILYKKFIYNVYTFYNDNEDIYEYIDNDDNDYDYDNDNDNYDDYDNDMNLNIDKKTHFLKHKHVNSKKDIKKDKDNLFSMYEDPLFYTIDTIKQKIYMKLYKCYFFVNYIYLENILYIEPIENIFVTVNALNLKLQLLIDYKNKTTSRLTFINKITKLIDTYPLQEYENEYLCNGTLKKSLIYKQVIDSL